MLTAYKESAQLSRFQWTPCPALPIKIILDFSATHCSEIWFFVEVWEIKLLPKINCGKFKHFPLTFMARATFTLTPYIPLILGNSNWYAVGIVWTYFSVIYSIAAIAIHHWKYHWISCKVQHNYQGLLTSSNKIFVGWFHLANLEIS